MSEETKMTPVDDEALDEVVGGITAKTVKSGAVLAARNKNVLKAEGKVANKNMMANKNMVATKKQTVAAKNIKPAAKTAKPTAKTVKLRSLGKRTGNTKKASI